MKTNLKVFLVALCAGGMVTAQAQTTVYSPSDVPSTYQSLDNTNSPEAVLHQLPASEQAKAYIYNGKVYLPKDDILGMGLSHDAATGVAAGSQATASSAAAGSTAVIIALGVGVFAVIGAIVAGSSSNTTTATVSTVSTHK